MVAAQLAKASRVASSRSNRLLEESSGGPKWAWLLFASPFLLSTPPSAVFWWFFFRKVTETYEFRNDTCFLSVIVTEPCGLHNHPLFDLRNVTEPHLIKQRCFHLIFGVSRKLTDCASIFFWFFGMSWNFTNCLMMGAKHLTRTKERSHVIKQRSPDEIRVWQLPLFTYLLSDIRGKQR